jgi:hypothetical protein
MGRDRRCRPERRFNITVFEFPAKPDGFPMNVLGVAFSDLHARLPEVLANAAQPRFRPFPGPLLRARLGDLLVVTVTNAMAERITDIHWHGVALTNNAWMDGATGSVFSQYANRKRMEGRHENVNLKLLSRSLSSSLPFFVCLFVIQVLRASASSLVGSSHTRSLPSERAPSGITRMPTPSTFF